MQDADHTIVFRGLRSRMVLGTGEAATPGLSGASWSHPLERHGRLLPKLRAVAAITHGCQVCGQAALTRGCEQASWVECLM